MDYDLHLETLSDQEGNFSGLKSSADELVNDCNDLASTISQSSEISGLENSLKDASSKIENGYNNCNDWIKGYNTDINSAEDELASFDGPILNADFSNIFTKILVPALKGTDGGKNAIQDLGSLGPPCPYTDEEIKRIIDAANSVPSPGGGLCAAWVTQVYEAAGLNAPYGHAYQQYENCCNYDDINDLRPGMLIAVPTHNKSDAGRTYGHVGIYVGNGMMLDNIGYIRQISVQEWVDFYGEKATPKWGWPPA